MQFELNSIPYISFFFIGALKYYNFTEIKKEFCNNPNVPIKLVLILVTILLLSAIIEYNLGHYFILLLLLVQSIILNGYTKDIKNKQDLDAKLFVTVMFLFGAFIISSLYSTKHDIIKILFIVLGLCVLFGINYLVLVTSDPSKKHKFKNMITNTVFGALVPMLVLLWCENERKPLVKYVKLFYRK
jgi:hypothetical protein